MPAIRPSSRPEFTLQSVATKENYVNAGKLFRAMMLPALSPLDRQPGNPAIFTEHFRQINFNCRAIGLRGRFSQRDGGVAGRGL